MTQDREELKRRFIEADGDDHERGCEGRNYACTCGYDDRTLALLRDAKSLLSDLEAMQDALVEAAIPIEALFMSGSNMVLSPNLANGFQVALNRIRQAIPKDPEA